MSFTLPNQILDSCESTNDVCRQIALDGFPQGSWIAARVQTLGRGRLGRTWTSLEGNLFFSILWKDFPKERQSWISLVSGVVIVETIGRLLPELDLRLKWPNDLHVGERKVGGILCEGIQVGPAHAVITGVGLNLSKTPVIEDRKVGNLSELSGNHVGIDDVLEPIVSAFRTNQRWFNDVSEEQLKTRFWRNSLFKIGDEIHWSVTHRGIVLGLDSFGGLQVDENGQKKTLYAEEIQSVRTM